MKKRIILTLAAWSAGCFAVGAQSATSSSQNNPTPTVSAPVTDATTRERATQNLAALQSVGRDAALFADERQRLEQNLATQQEVAAVEAENAAQDAFRAVKLFDEGRARSRPILVTTTLTNAEALAKLDEDLKVMSHILDKTVSPAASKEQNQMLGIWVSQQSGGHGPQSLYIEGQGAVFIRNVRVAFLPGNTSETEKTATKKDSAWEEAKRELDGPRRWTKFNSSDTKETTPYDAEKVETLKREVVGALKNAANIRGLAENESVTVVLQGVSEGRVIASVYDPNGAPRTITVDGRPESGRATTMVIRMKRADAEAALNGSIDAAELRRRATISVY